MIHLKGNEACKGAYLEALIENHFKTISQF